MGGLTGVVHWWEESQLRVLVLTSLVIQYFLLSFPILRRQAISSWFRFIMWLAYHGGDAVAIYALATLFNRHKVDEGDSGVGGGSSSNRLLEVVWAPILLIHLGGQDGVTAYNIEDNELWSRHLLTVVSQVTVAVYVFCKSWPPGGDKCLLAAAILLFIVGVVKCFVKAWAFKRASIYSLVSSGAATKQINDGSMYKLKEYVKLARDIVVQQQQEEEDPGTVTTKQALALLFCPPGLRGVRQEARRRQEKERLLQERGEAPKLFVDLSSPYPHRISIFKKFWGLREDRAYDSVQGGLASAFFLLYTKLKTALPEKINEYRIGSICMLFTRAVLTWASIGLFQLSHRQAYNGTDVKVTYALLCCTAMLDVWSWQAVVMEVDVTDSPPHSRLFQKVWPETVAQYSLAGYFVRNKKHNIKMGIVRFFQCKDFVDQLWCMEPCFTSARITSLVLRYLEDGWKQKIQDAATYRSFNNHSSHCGLNMNRPFDECVLLWHLATDFCFFSSTSFPDHKCDFAEPPTRETKTLKRFIVHLFRQMVPAGKCTSVAKSPTSTTSRPECRQESAECKAVQCRQMSNYMVYLLFVNPEMLLPGSRRNLFTTAYDELKGILNLKDGEWKWNPVCWSRCMPCGVKLMKEEADVMKELIKRMDKKTGKRPSQEESSNEATVPQTAIAATPEKSERSSQEGSSMKGSNKEESFIDEAWDIARKLMKMGDEVKRWKEIQDVWVQMLCFSASRCRGYLHAKALGEGGEFLSYIWLLLFYMGMETFSERLQRELLPCCQGNNGTAPPPTSIGASTTPPSTSTGAGIAPPPTFTGARTAPPPTSEICSTFSSASTVHTRAGASRHHCIDF